MKAESAREHRHNNECVFVLSTRPDGIPTVYERRVRPNTTKLDDIRHGLVVYEPTLDAVHHDFELDGRIRLMECELVKWTTIHVPQKNRGFSRTYMLRQYLELQTPKSVGLEAPIMAIIDIHRFGASSTADIDRWDATPVHELWIPTSFSPDNERVLQPPFRDFADIDRIATNDRFPVTTLMNRAQELINQGAFPRQLGMRYVE